MQKKSVWDISLVSVDMSVGVRYKNRQTKIRLMLEISLVTLF